MFCSNRASFCTLPFNEQKMNDWLIKLKHNETMQSNSVISISLSISARKHFPVLSRWKIIRPFADTAHVTTTDRQTDRQTDIQSNLNCFVKRPQTSMRIEPSCAAPATRKMHHSL